MQLSVTGKQVDVSDSFRSHAGQVLSTTVDKYFGNAMECSVVLSREAHFVRADISVHVGRGIQLRGHAAAADAYAAFDGAAQRIGKRLRRHKRRLRDHRRGDIASRELILAQQYVLASPSDDEADEGSAGTTGDNPIVIAEMTTEIETLSLEEAVMRLDLGDHPALLFHNKSLGRLNMIYRRPDGNIGWVDPVGGAAGPAAG